jgi:hypothetical protein
VKNDKEFLAGKIRSILERRVTQALECKPSDLPRMKIGTLVHFLFLLEGGSQEVGGFSTSMSAVLQLLDFETVWDVAPKEESDATDPQKGEVIN